MESMTISEKPVVHVYRGQGQKKIQLIIYRQVNNNENSNKNYIYIYIVSKPIFIKNGQKYEGGKGNGGVRQSNGEYGKKEKNRKKTLIHKQIHTNNEMPKFNTTQYRNSIVIDITLHVLVN